MPRGNYYKTRPPIYKRIEPKMEEDNGESTYIKKIVDDSSNDSNNDSSNDCKKMNMKWTTVEYANSGDPKVWGPAFWFTLHNGAARYPIKASPICKESMKGFIMGMPYMIPCEKCQDHAFAHIEQNYYRINEIVSGREQLFNFFVSFHNYVNKRYGKPEMDYKTAYDLYTSSTNVTKLTYSESNC
jgi:hypothetical protein